MKQEIIDELIAAAAEALRIRALSVSAEHVPPLDGLALYKDILAIEARLVAAIQRAREQ